VGSVPVVAEQKLTRFLIALAHSSELMDRFNSREREELLREWGLGDHPALAENATLAEVQEAVEKENTGADVAWWIRLAQVAPDTWVVESAEEAGGPDSTTGGGEPTAN
jgi:hypothetical protein